MLGRPPHEENSEGSSRINLLSELPGSARAVWVVTSDEYLLFRKVRRSRLLKLLQIVSQ